MYIQPDQVALLPSSIQLNYQATIYWIYFSSDKVSCFLCKEEGHLAKYCKNIEPNSQLTTTQSDNSSINTNTALNSSLIDRNVTTSAKDPLIQNSIFTIDEKISSLPLITNNITDDYVAMPPPMLDNKLNNKRTLSTNSTSDSSSVKAVRSTPKKHKNSKNESTVSISEIIEQLNPAKEFFSFNSCSYQLDFQSTALFLQSAFGSSDIQGAASSYTNDYERLTNLLQQIKDMIENKNLRSRIKRIIMRFKNKSTDSYTELSSEVEDI